MPRYLGKLPLNAGGYGYHVSPLVSLVLGQLSVPLQSMPISSPSASMSTKNNHRIYCIDHSSQYKFNLRIYIYIYLFPLS